MPFDDRLITNMLPETNFQNIIFEDGNILTHRKLFHSEVSRIEEGLNG